MTPASEAELANKLKNLCDEKGRERKENLNETTKILHKFGILYLDKSPHRISLIRSAIFLNAALVRRPNDVQIQQDLHTLCQHVLQLAGVKNNKIDLCEFSAEVKKTVDQMREHVAAALKEIKVIPSKLAAPELHGLRELKIRKVEKLQAYITDEFTKIMKVIAEKCAFLMGNPPCKCKYSVTGMGSIARKEISPYSDFEHVILLEEGTQNHPNYEETLEFFRWFTVMFQLIVVNLKETTVYDAAAPFLNDDLSPKDDWFYDDYTTCGIKFDCMQFRACKFPLGRSRTTTEIQWTFELIKPVSLMLKYLDPQEKKKNYQLALADILTKTCYVAGDRDIHEEFQRKANALLEKGGLTEITIPLMQDLSSFNPMIKISLTNVANMCDVKRVLYRTTTLFISALGRLSKINQYCCFDIIKKIQEANKFSEETAHHLSYAVAIACEARLRVYMLNKGQDDFFGGRRYEMNDDKTLQLLIDLLGQQSLGDYFVIAFTLQKAISDNNLLHLRSFPYKIWHKFMLFWNLDLKDRFYFEWETLQADRSPAKVLATNAENFFILYAVAKMDRRSENYEKALQTLDLISELSHESEEILDDPDIRLIAPVLKSDCLQEKVQCLNALKRHQEALEFSAKAIYLNSKLDLTNDERALNVGTLYFYVGQACELLGRFEEAVNNFEKSILYLEQSTSPFRKNFIIRCHTGIAFSKFRLGSMVDVIVHHLTEAYKLHFDASIEMKLICDCCSALFEFHLALNQPIKAKFYLEEELRFRLRHCNLEDQDTNEDIQQCKERLQIFDNIPENANQDVTNKATNAS